MVLEDPEPWPDPICGDSLIDGLTSTIRRYVSLSEESALAAALWVIHTHAFAHAQFSPRLTLSSPEKRCGKTTLLSVLERMVAKPLPVANVTAAALFRTVEKVQPTLLIDEADTFIRNGDELRGILNSGHSRTNAFVLRTVGDDHEPRRFSTWAPVAIALIGKLPDTLEDRSIVIPMRRRLPGEAGERLRMDRVADLTLLQRQCARWVEDNADDLSDRDPDTPEALHDRAADNWRALLAIADQAGDQWPGLARAAAVSLSEGIKEDQSARVQLLADVKTILEAGGIERIASAHLCARLAIMEDRPWPE